ncbi:MAG: hypothetical protein AB1523_12995 [Bacillota bacterium]
MPDLFTYDSLGSLTGAVTATVLVVQFLKNLEPFKRFPSRWLALAVAEGVVAVNSIATGHFTLKELPLHLLNGLLVAASAIGSWEVIHDNLFGGPQKERGSNPCKENQSSGK